MAFKTFKTIGIGSIAAGGQAESIWESDGDYTLHKIIIVEKTGASINQVEVTIRIDGTILTKDVVPAVVLSLANNNPTIIDTDLKDGQKITFGLKNNESASRNLYAVLELWA
jgi:hypothetical protein